MDSSAQASDRRQRRLREELDDAGIQLPVDVELADGLIEELDYARFPPVHEGALPTYGAVLLDPTIQATDLGGTSSPITSVDTAVLRLLADGRHSFVLRHHDHEELLLFDAAHDREAELVHLRSKANSRSTVIVQRGASGLVRVLAPDGLFIWDGAHWWTKPYAASFARTVQRAMPQAPTVALHELLDFCVHTMSPADAGAALVWALDADTTTDVTGLNRAHPPTSIPHLPFHDIATRAAIRQLLTHVDGAAILNRDGHLMAIGAHLRSSAKSHELVNLDATRGTRHAAARRYSFDHDNTIVFVVSRDGPVTVYSNGVEITSIQSRLEDPDHTVDIVSVPTAPPPRALATSPEDDTTPPTTTNQTEPNSSPTSSSTTSTKPPGPASMIPPQDS